MKTFNRVYELVASIPKGKVTTYGAISRIIGINPKIVGYALHANKNSFEIPCHRVIKTNGMIANGYTFGGPDIQKKMLIQEGVIFGKDERVDLNKFGLFIS